jgi:hypothetical protein
MSDCYQQSAAVSFKAAMSMESFKRCGKTFLADLQEDWRTMLYDEESKDFTLIIGPEREKLAIHKTVLIARCHNIRRSISSNCSELLLPSADNLTMKRIQQFLYTAELDVTDAFGVNSLLRISHKLGIPSLSNHLIELFDTLLTADNVCSILTSLHETISQTDVSTDNDDDDSFHQDLWHMIDQCLQFILQHKSPVLNSDGFLEMTQGSMILLVSAKLQVTYQEILKAILRWARYQVGTSKVLQSEWTETERERVRVHIEEVVKHIHVANGRMSPDSVTDGVYGILER